MPVPSTCRRALLFFGLSLVSCGGTDDGGFTYTSTQVELTGGTEIRQNGLVIELGPGVTYESTSVSQSNGEVFQETLVNGHAFAIHPDAIAIGEQRFDGLVAGDVILLEESGISVNGERRWDMPAK